MFGKEILQMKTFYNATYTKLKVGTENGVKCFILRKEKEFLYFHKLRAKRKFEIQEQLL